METEYQKFDRKRTFIKNCSNFSCIKQNAKYYLLNKDRKTSVAIFFNDDGDIMQEGVTFKREYSNNEGYHWVFEPTTISTKYFLEKNINNITTDFEEAKYLAFSHIN